MYPNNRTFYKANMNKLYNHDMSLKQYRVLEIYIVIYTLSFSPDNSLTF